MPQPDAGRAGPATTPSPDSTQLTTFTVLHIDGAFVVARGEWSSPRDGYRAQRGEWVWCGSPGWFADVGRERFDALCQLVEDFLSSRWSDGMWDTFTAPCFPGLESDQYAARSPVMDGPAAADRSPRRRRPPMTRAEARRWSRLSRRSGHFERSALLDEFTCPLATRAGDRHYVQVHHKAWESSTAALVDAAFIQHLSSPHADERCPFVEAAG
jgi:hypothetical protein